MGDLDEQSEAKKISATGKPRQKKAAVGSRYEADS
jgi:hypothetical protein